MTAPATAAAVRAGIALFTEHPFLFDADGNAFQVARTAYLKIDLCGAARLAELAGSAASEALAPLAASAGDKPSVPVFVGLPSARPGRPMDAATALIARLQAEVTQLQLQPGKIQVIETGHSAGTMAVQAAWEVVSSGANMVALCGGVDSYLEPETMAWLQASGQVHGAEDNSWGFIPGEAAGFVLLAADHLANRFGYAVALEVVSTATAQETKLIKTDAVCTGKGLTNLFRALGARLRAGTRVDNLICDMNGEPYRADEFGFAILRAGELFRDPSAFDTPATCWGDVGAAAGPLFLVLSDAAARKGYNCGPVTVAFTSSESGERCGFVARALSVSQ
jgi:3-oxoacyl-[acyl-carrier-protein] synthase-1